MFHRQHENRHRHILLLVSRLFSTHFLSTPFRSASRDTDALRALRGAAVAICTEAIDRATVPLSAILTVAGRLVIVPADGGGARAGDGCIVLPGTFFLAGFRALPVF